MKKLVLAALAAAALAGASCSRSGDDSTIAFESYEAISSWRFTAEGVDSDAVYADSVSIVMPVSIAGCDITALRDSIMSMAFGVTGKPIAEAADTWMRTNAADKGCTGQPLDPTGQYDAVGFDNLSGFVANMQPDILVYCVRQEEYGVANDLTTRRYINFALKNGGYIITLDHIFTPEGLANLPARIAEQAQAISDIIGTTTIDALPGDGNFYISSEDEIVFSYQPYEVASHAQGTVDIAFFPYELVDYMTSEGIHMFHLEDLSNE